jgi:ABC-type xylose transport system permease subunit
MVKLRSFKDDENGLIGVLALIIILMVVFIWTISSIASMIVPLAVFMILAITLILIIKYVFFGGKGFSFIGATSKAARYGGKESVGLMQSAKHEYAHYKKREGGWR